MSRFGKLARRLPAARWRALVPIVCLLAGFGFAVTVHQSHNSQLRAPSNANLADLVHNAESDVHAAERTYAALQAQLAAATQAAGHDDAAVAAAQRTAGTIAAPIRSLRFRTAHIGAACDDLPFHGHLRRSPVR